MNFIDYSLTDGDQNRVAALNAWDPDSDVGRLMADQHGHWMGGTINLGRGTIYAWGVTHPPTGFRINVESIMVGDADENVPVSKIAIDVASHYLNSINWPRDKIQWWPKHTKWDITKAGAR